MSQKMCCDLKIDSLWEMHPHQVQQKLQAGRIRLLDVRHEVEWELGHIAGATLIPLDHLSARLEELASWRQEQVVVYCRSGIRSLTAAQMMREAGFASVHSMAGGIHAWVEHVDPEIRWW